MKPSRVLFATFIAMLSVQTVGSIDAQHRLPPPRKYALISITWGVLFFVADLGTGPRKMAARLALLILLTSMVLGPFGKVAVTFLNTVTKLLAIPPDQGIPGIVGTDGVTGSNPIPSTTQTT